MNKSIEPKKEDVGLVNYSSGYLSLPFDNEHFKEFIGKLLGKPREKTSILVGDFDISKEEILDLHQIVSQRVLQNEGALIQFKTVIYFSDNTDVTLSSLEEFVTHTELGPKVSVGVMLSWNYLINFPSKNVPEKQEIVISIGAPAVTGETDAKETGNSFISYLLSNHNSGFFNITIFATEITWGEDLMNTLKDRIRVYFRKENKTAKFFFKYKLIISWIFGIIAFAGFLYGIQKARNIDYDDRYQAIKNSTDEFLRSENPSLDKKLDFFIRYEVQSDYQTSYNGLLDLFCAFSPILLSIIIGYVIFYLADNKMPSFIVLTKESEKYKQYVMKQYQMQWVYFAISIIVAICTNLISSWVYDLIK